VSKRAALIWYTVATLVALLISQLYGWEAIRNWIVVAWIVVMLLVAMTRGMRWTSLLTYLSVVALLGAVTSQLAGWNSARDWFLLAWAVLLLPVSIGLASHPMRAPAWGVFVGFWGVVGAIWLIVIQIIVVVGWVSRGAAAEPSAWPLGLLGIWFLVASSLGFGAERFPRWIDVLGMLAGIGLIAISISTWVEVSGDVTRAEGLFAAAAYCLWAAGLGWVFRGTQHVTDRFRGLQMRAV
jgi:hypothetical protein